MVCAGFLIYAWHPEIERVARPDPAAFDEPLVKKGAQLAALGNCIACHTVPGGRSFAGGLPLPTPFGTIYSTNITPDDATGTLDAARESASYFGLAKSRAEAIIVPMR